MWFVARRTTLKPDRPMLEGERTTLIAMAREAARLICSECLDHRRTHGSMRVVAIDAGHCLFRQLVVVRPLKLGPNIRMTTAAQLIDCRDGARHQR